jgi:alkylation response protein AidB-like acyl-CoA dehydrogenase
MVEKIKRDVRITTIYEGTSEIMEWTIARDRWQTPPQEPGPVLPRLGGGSEARHAQSPSVGAGLAAMALRSLGALLERARLDRLTRNQHVLFRLGELIAYAETAALFAERAAAAPAKASGLEPATLEAMARVHAREACSRWRPRACAGRSGPGRPTQAWPSS